MADENHGQMLLQQQAAQQQQQMQQSAQMQQPQQMQQSQLQQQQMQQVQMQQQSQLQQQSQMQQLQHQSQMQQQSQMQAPQQQNAASTISMGSTVEQANHMNVTTSLPINVISASQPQQMPTMQQGVNTSSGTPVQMSVSQMNTSSGAPVHMTQLNTSTGTPVQMAVPQLNTSTGTPVQMTVPQLTAQAQNAGNMMAQSSGHHTMLHPTMTMAQAPLQQVQVIQQPLSASYLQHLYPQQQMLFPGMTLQHGAGGPTLQSLGTQGLSFQLQAKPNLDPKSAGGAQSLQAVNANKQGMTVNAGTMMTASGQMISTGQKGNFQQQMMAGPGKSTIIHSQTGFAPGNANQTVVIGQLGVLPNQQSIFNHKALADSQKGKTFTFQNQPTALQPKSIYSNLPVHSSAQVFNGGHLKQISSQPQIITSQAPGNVLNQAQLFGLQALGASLPPGLSWATPGCLQSSALLSQNPIIIRSSQESNMFIQSQPQTAMHLPVAAATQHVPPTSYASSVTVPHKHKQVRPGTQTVAVATQTVVSSAATVNSNTPPIRAQDSPHAIIGGKQIWTKIKPKAPKHSGPASPLPVLPQMATTQTQTNQSPPQPPAPQPLPQSVQQPIPQAMHPKSDAGNQTQIHQMVDRKPLATYSRSVAVEAKQPQHLPMQKSQAMVAPSAKIVQATVAPSIGMSTSTLTTVSSTTPVLTTSTVHVNTCVSTVDVVSSTMPSVSHVSPMAHIEAFEPEFEVSKTLSVATEPVKESVTSQPTESMEVSTETEHLKPQQPIGKPSLGVVKEKQPQKAIVKPQVLKHVIDGFLILEGPEPFPVRSALLDSPCGISPPKKQDSNQKRKESPPVASPEKKLKVHRGRGNVELAKCEFCGKLGPKNKFKRSKRFCSTSCAKRYNVSCAKHVGRLQQANQANAAAGPGRRKKTGRGRKGTRKQMEIEENDEMNANPVEEMNTSLADDGSSTYSNKTEEENSDLQEDISQPLTESPEEEMESQQVESDAPQKLPTRWSVQDVFEFIRDTPGCSEYADTFRSQEIDGQALLLLEDHHLMSVMSMKVGPALKLIKQIKSIKDELTHP